MASAYTHVSSNKAKTFFLISFFLVFVIAIGWVFSYVLDNPLILVLAVIVSVLQSVSAYWFSDKLTILMSGAKPVTKQEAPELYTSVELISIAAGLPMPKVYMINDTAPNAFATGRDPKHAALVVTSGLLQKLDKRQLEAVIAHEFAHIGNYDIRLQTVVVILVGIITLISDWFLRFTFSGGDDDSGDSRIRLALMLVGILLALLSPLIATLIQLAISRKREFLADADGALISGRPDQLAQALQIISSDTEPLEAANKATAHLYIASPLKELKGTKRGWFTGLFETHPPAEERIVRLNQMFDRQSQGSADTGVSANV